MIKKYQGGGANVNSSQIYDRRYVWRWTYLLKFELAGLIGRTFFSRPPYPKSKLLHLGCGDNYLDEFVNADFYYLRWVPFRKQPGKYDWLADFRYKLNCPDNYWEGVFSEHTVEHLHYSDCLQLFKELYRTMKPNAWLRICVPGLEEVLNINSKQTMAIAIYNLTQNYGHVSVWDSVLMTEVLKEAGFTKIYKVSYRKGSDPRLLQDSAGRSQGSLYMEARK
jgi:predicted SAM-dependent methyltransferase